MSPIITEDQHLRAAEGYFELEMYEESLEELEIADETPENAMEVTIRRLEVFLAQKRWLEALPYGEALCDLDPEEANYFIQYAYALRELDRIEEAREVLVNGPEKLEELGIYHYNLGCYDALLGDVAAALSHLASSFTLDPSLRMAAKTDPDLDAIRNELPPDPPTG